MSENDWKWPQRVPQSQPPQQNVQKNNQNIVTDYSVAGQRQLKRLKKNKRNRILIIAVSIAVGLLLGLIGSDTVRIPGEPNPYFLSK